MKHPMEDHMLLTSEQIASLSEKGWKQRFIHIMHNYSADEMFTDEQDNLFIFTMWRSGPVYLHHADITD